MTFENIICKWLPLFIAVLSLFNICVFDLTGWVAAHL